MKLVLVGIGGPSSSGKTTVATALHLLFPHSTLVHLDDFYFPDDQIPTDAAQGIQNWDCADAIDWQKFSEYIGKVRESNGAMLPMETLELDLQLKLAPEDLLKLKEQVDTLVAGEKLHVVFVDGFMLYHDNAILDLFDVKLFFRAPYGVLKARREARAGYNTVSGFWVDPPNYFDNIVWPEFANSHKHLFENGDIDGNLNEASKSLGLADVVNDGSRTLAELVGWALDQILLQI